MRIDPSLQDNISCPSHAHSTIILMLYSIIRL
jgi:hypothetical protein